MRRLISSLFVCMILLSGCKGAAEKTATPESPAHNVPPAAYPGPNTANPQDTDQGSQVYPAPQVRNPTSVPYPQPGSSGGQTAASENFAPAAGDEKLTRGPATVVIQESEVIVMESAPVQIKLHLKGTLPNPCYYLRVNPAQPDDQKKIQVEVYSVTKPGDICADMIQEFDVEVQMGSFSSGHYSVYINGELLGEFDA